MQFYSGTFRSKETTTNPQNETKGQPENIRKLYLIINLSNTFHKRESKIEQNPTLKGSSKSIKLSDVSIGFPQRTRYEIEYEV